MIAVVDISSSGPLIAIWYILSNLAKIEPGVIIRDFISEMDNGDPYMNADQGYPWIGIEWDNGFISIPT